MRIPFCHSTFDKLDLCLNRLLKVFSLIVTFLKYLEFNTYGFYLEMVISVGSMEVESVAQARPDSDFLWQSGTV